jgi:hypothetical protein
MFLVIVVALLWLLHRTTRLLKVPAPALIHVLGIDIPESPKVSVDSVTSTSISLHWPPPERAAVVKYILEVNGRKVGETDRMDSNVTLKDLQPNSPYNVKVLAVNTSNYRSHAASVFAHTLKSMDEGLPNNVHVAGLSSCTDSTTSTLRLRSSSRAARERLRDINKIKSNKAYTVESLTNEVESVQIEINEILAQAVHGEEEFLAAEQELLGELEQLKTRKRSDDHQRGLIRSETKTLEDSKRNLETQKLKAEKKLQKIQEIFDKRVQERQRWAEELERAENEATQLESSFGPFNDEFQQIINELHGSIEYRQLQLSTFEDALKEAASMLRKIEFCKTATLEELERLRKNTDNVTGLVKADAILALMENPDVHERLKTEIQNEVDMNKRLETQWEKVQKDLEVRYVNVSQQYRESTDTYNKTIAIVNGSTAPIVSGGASGDGGSSGVTTVADSVNAAIQKGKKRNRRKSNKNMGFQPPLPTGPIPREYYPSTMDSSGDTYGTGAYFALNTDAVATEEEAGPMSPSVDMLLPSNLFGTDDLTESFSNLINEFPTSQRASGSILANAFGGTNQATSSSPQPSVTSLGDGHGPSASGPSSRHDSFSGSFTPFPRTLAYNGSMQSLVDSPAPKKEPSNTAKRFSSMFFFNKPKRDQDPLFFKPEAAESDPLSVGPIGSRARAGSYSSVISGVASIHGNGSGFHNPWKDTTTTDQSLLAPAISNNASVRSSEGGVISNGFPGAWSVFDHEGHANLANPVPGDESALASSPESGWLGMPSLVVSDTQQSSAHSVGSRSSTGGTPGASTSSNSGSKFSKGFAGLFSLDKEGREPREGMSRWKSESKSIAVLFGGKSDDGMAPEQPLSASVESKDSLNKESPVQKRMWTFAGGSRKSSSSSSSSKFVRRLSLFGKKGDHGREETEDESIIVEDSEEPDDKEELAIVRE